MLWMIFFCLAVAVLGFMTLITVVGALRRAAGYKALLGTMLAGVLIAAFLLFLPVYIQVLRDSNSGLLEAVLVAIHSVLKLFTIDGDFLMVSQQLAALPGWLCTAYGALLSLLFLLVPVLASVYVLSFFTRVKQTFILLTSRRRPIYLFSDLNDKSLTLAEDVTKGRRALVVFADVFRKQEEQSRDWMIRAERLGALCFSDDAVVLYTRYFRDYSSKTPYIRLLFIGEDENENVHQTTEVAKTLDGEKPTTVFVFTNQPEAETLLSAVACPSDKVQFRLISDARRVAYDLMEREGYELLYKSAAEDKTMSVVVLGMGRHGAELVKILSWMGQMDGYRLQIHVFDRDPMAPSRFASQCPELVSPPSVGEGMPYHDITIHAPADVTTSEFDKIILSLPAVTCVLVAMGDDSRNINTAIKMRQLCARMGWHPPVRALIYDAWRADCVSQLRTYQNAPYDIGCFGGLTDTYSKDLVDGSDNEQEAYRLHSMWSDGGWRNEYEYRSSMAMVMHKGMRSRCGIPGNDRAPADRTVYENEALRRLEHRRWVAYMRSEGYCYGPVRDALAKLHPLMIPYGMLPEQEKTKDV